MINSG